MLFLLNFLALTAHAEPSPTETRVRSGLEFLREHQSDGHDGYDLGQWAAQVTSTLPSVVGVGRYGEAYEEPTIFGASSVANILAEIYFLDPSYDAVPAMVSKTLLGFEPYRWGPVFHFYPPGTYQGTPVRAPRYMFLEPQWQGFTNTPPDADSTSVSYLLLAYDQALRMGVKALDSGYALPDAAARSFSRFRDERRIPHLYNDMHADRDTGAYLTWLWDEKDPAMPHNYFAPPDEGTRIPFNKNDVDCVVNVNVLKVLTATKRQSTPGYRAACDYLNGLVEKHEFYTCGMYYPNEYALPYAMGAATDLGVKCLEPSRKGLVRIMLDQQGENGAWENDARNPRRDYIQSTAWALNSLLLLGNPASSKQRLAVRRGLDYLLGRAKHDKHGHLYWPGEVFYGAIFIARKPVVWRSYPYTTALILRALVTADKKWGLR